MMSVSVPGTLIKLPTWLGAALFTSTSTLGMTLMAVGDVTASVAATVPDWLPNAEGSTATVTEAGVTPLEGETETPAVLELMLKGVLLPPGSAMVSRWVETPGLQKLPRNTRLCCCATTRGCLARLPTGRMVTPLAETA